MDGTGYSSKQDTNTSLNGKQMQTSTQLRGSRDTSPSMLNARGVKSLKTKVKPRVVTHAHHTAAKCDITPQSGWTVCTGSHLIFPYCYDTRGPGAFRHGWLYSRSSWSLRFPVLRKEIHLASVTVLFCAPSSHSLSPASVQQPEVLSQQEQSRGRAPTQPLVAQGEGKS